jgi:hypothetical protein
MKAGHHDVGEGAAFSGQPSGIVAPLRVYRAMPVSAW